MFQRILVCLDGSKLAEQILPYAAEEALHFDSKLILLQVVTLPGTIVTPAVPGVPGVPVPVPVSAKAKAEAMQKEEATARAYLESAVKLLQAKGLNAEWVTQQGPPVGEAIVNYAKQNKIDLIAMATHGRSGLGRAVLGSIADYVMRESGLPILIIRPKKEA